MISLFAVFLFAYRKLDLCQALTFALLLAAPVCLATPPSVSLKNTPDGAESLLIPSRTSSRLHSPPNVGQIYNSHSRETSL